MVYKFFLIVVLYSLSFNLNGSHSNPNLSSQISFDDLHKLPRLSLGFDNKKKIIHCKCAGCKYLTHLSIKQPKRVLQITALSVFYDDNNNEINGLEFYSAFTKK